FFSSRRRHTRSDRDWSSDVCSSDLLTGPNGRWSFPAGGWQVQQDQLGNPVLASTAAGLNVATPNGATYTGAGTWRNYRVTVGLQIGRASCRERVEIWVVGGV